MPKGVDTRYHPNRLILNPVEGLTGVSSIAGDVQAYTHDHGVSGRGDIYDAFATPMEAAQDRQEQLSGYAMSAHYYQDEPEVDHYLGLSKQARGEIAAYEQR